MSMSPYSAIVNYTIFSFVIGVKCDLDISLKVLIFSQIFSFKMCCYCAFWSVQHYLIALNKCCNFATVGL